MMSGVERAIALVSGLLTILMTVVRFGDQGGFPEDASGFPRAIFELSRLL